MTLVREGKRELRRQAVDLQVLACYDRSGGNSGAGKRRDFGRHFLRLGAAVPAVREGKRELRRQAVDLQVLACYDRSGGNSGAGKRRAF